MTHPDRDPLAARIEAVIRTWEGEPVWTRGDVIAGLRAALAPRPPETADPAKDETAWLIERGQPERQVPTVWWADRLRWGLTYMDEWTEDAFKAARFDSREAAEEVIARKFTPLARATYGGPSARAVEHGFIESPETADAGALDAATALHLTLAANGIDREVGNRVVEGFLAIRRDATSRLDVSRLTDAVRWVLGDVDCAHMYLDGTWQTFGRRIAAEYERPGSVPLRAAETPRVPPQGANHWDWCAKVNSRGASAKCNCGGPAARRAAEAK